MQNNQSNIFMLPNFRTALLFLVSLAFLSVSFWGIGSKIMSQDDINDVAFTTPEEAITFYIQAVVSGDVSEIMHVSAAEEMGENFQFDLYVNRLRALSPQAPAPSDYPFYAEINKAQFSNQLLFQTRNFVYGLLSTQQALLAGQTVLIDPEETLMFITEVDPERLDVLEVTAIGIPSPEIAQSERNIEIWNTLAQIYGADEHTERVALLISEGDYYYVGFTLLRYGNDWKISNLASPLGNTNALGAPQQITEDEFRELIDNS